MGAPTIETENLTIRPFIIDDVAKVFKLSQEEGMKQWVPDQVYKDEAETEEVLKHLMSQYSKPFDPTKNPLVLAIEHFEKEIVIGHIGLSQYDDEFAEIGYAIGDRYKKMGFASEAVKALSSWAVEFKKLKKIMGVVSKENVGSYKVLKNAKYKLIEEKEMNYLGKNTLCQLYSYP